MNFNEKWLEWAVELQSLAQAGLTSLIVFSFTDTLTSTQPPGSDHFPLFSFTRSILLSLKIAALVSSLGV